MKPRTSYCILSDKSEFLRHVVTKHLLAINLKDGVYPDRSLFGSYVLVSDNDDPIPNKRFIISTKDRGFAIINLDEDPLPTLYEILAIECTEYKRFVRHKVYNKHGVTPESLYYYMILLRDCIKADGSLNTTRAELIIDNYRYANRSSMLEKYRSLNNYVTKPSEETLFALIKVFSDDQDEQRRFRSLAFLIKNILNGDVPSYIESRITFSQDQEALINYLVLASEVALFEDFDTFISALISKLVS